MLRLTKEFMEDVEWWRWCLKEGVAAERRNVGGAFLQIRRADPQGDLVFGCIVRGGWEVVPGDGSVPEIQLVRGEVKKTYGQGWRMWVMWRDTRGERNSLERT